MEVTHKTMRLLVLAFAVIITGCEQTGSAATSPASNENQAADPVVEDVPVFYVRRILMREDANPLSITPRQLNVFEPGAELILKDRAISSATERNISDQAFVDETSAIVPLYDVRDLEPDYDGEQLVFSMRGPFDPDVQLEDQPSWNIWIYNLGTDELRRVIESDTTAEAGQDRDPHFLPDGRIVFTSNRQRQSKAILLDEGRPQFAALDEDRREEAFVLHVMTDFGMDLEQLTFNQSHDQDPGMLRDGQIVFNRWDNIPGRDVISLYKVNPDGTRLERLYGYHSQDSGRDGSNVLYLEPREMEDGRLLVLGKGEDETQIGGDLLLLDVENFVEIDEPTFENQGLLSGAQESPLTEVVQLGGPSLRGRFASAFPLYDGTDRLLVTWSQCRLLQQGDIVPCTEEKLTDTTNPAVEADPLFGLWILDLENDTQQPVVPPEEGFALTEAVVMTPRVAPFFLQSDPATDDTLTLINEAAGVLHIRSIHDFDGIDTAIPDLATLANPSLTSAAQRMSLFLRLVKPVSIPDDDLVNLPGSAFGRSRNELMREILGYATIHPDGSVYVKVPADVPFALSVLDTNGRRTSPRHRNWLQVRPGEVLECHGCHTRTSERPHGRRDAQAPSINDGGPYPGLDPGFLVNPGETMAEAYAARNGLPNPAFNLVFDDIWTDPANRNKDPGFSYQYQDLSTAAPISPACAALWQASCRATIHYEDYIHPIWSVNRPVFDIDGITLLEDQTCTSCHTPVDDMDLAQVPAAQLDLTDGPSVDEPDHFKSYSELLFNDSEQEVVNNLLIDRLVPVLDGNGDPVFETDVDGEFILDGNGDPIPVLTTVRVPPVMSTSGANASFFFSLFDTTGSHNNYLTPAELRLLSEWLDLGAQYYNDPFVVPQ